MSANPSPTPLAEFTGVLLHQAEARSKPIDADGHTAPVLCLDIELDSVLHTRLHIEQPFPVGHDAQARAAASRHRKGERITVQVPLADMRLIARNAVHIHVHPKEQP